MAFISVADLQGYTGTHVDDKKSLEIYVNSATEIVENYLGYGLALRTYNTVLDGNGTAEIQLRARPIKTVTRVIIDDAAIPAHHFETGGEFLVRTGGVFPTGTRNVRVVYEAGFDEKKTVVFDPDGENLLDGGHADSDFDVILDGGSALFEGRNTYLPEIIRNTVLRIAALLQTEAEGNIGITGKSFGDSGSRTFVSFTNFDKYLSPISGYKLIRI